jgi:hypothetical protein
VVVFSLREFLHAVSAYPSTERGDCIIHTVHDLTIADDVHPPDPIGLWPIFAHTEIRHDKKVLNKRYKIRPRFAIDEATDY